LAKQDDDHVIINHNLQCDSLCTITAYWSMDGGITFSELDNTYLTMDFGDDVRKGDHK
jgi:hypothetical protein